MSFHHFYNYSLSNDDADSLSFLLYDYLKASQNSKFRCRTIKDFMYFLLHTSLKENEVLNLLFEAIYHLPRIDILYECNIEYKDFEDFEFGKFIKMKRIYLFKIFNALSEEDFQGFVKLTYCDNGQGDVEMSTFQLLEFLMDKWMDDNEMERCLKILKKYNPISAIPGIIQRYKGCDKTKQIEIKIPTNVETQNIVVTLEKGDTTCPPSFLIDSKSGPKTIDYDPKSRYPFPENGSFKSVCLIFNICKYKNRERRGTHLDVENIRKTFSKLHFTIQVTEDATKAEMLDIVDLYSKLEIENAGMMFVCFILAHGEKDNIFDINEESVSCRELSMKLSAKNCEAYRGKPKVFFIQACQGERLQGICSTTVPTTESSFTVPQVEQDGRSKSRIKQYKDYTSTPEEADFIFGMATVADCVAFRNVNKGSWYIRALCKEIREKASKCHLIDILTNVTYNVSQKKYGVSYCQLPMCCTTATKKCYLTSVNDDSDNNNI